MGTIEQQFIKDTQGQNIGVLLPIDKYNSMLKKLEEFNDIKAFDAAKSADDEIIPFDQAIKEIEEKRDDL
jgi:hypothetical protein